MKILFSLLALLIAAPADARAPSSYTKAELNRLWRNVGGKQQKWVTSNSPHFWAWARVEGEGHVGAYLGPKGVLMGDPHPKNVFDYRAGRGKARLAIADVDDGGRGPLFLDFVRYVVYLESSGLGTKVGSLFNAYLAGLHGEAAETASLMAEAQGESRATIEGLHGRYVNKYVSDDKLDTEGLEIQSTKRLSEDRRREVALLGKEVLERSGLGKLWDQAYTEYDSGSSAGLARYWFLLGTATKPTRIVEAKELARPALAYYESQDGHSARVRQLVSAYTEDGLDQELFGVVEAGGKSFWLRPRKYQALDMDDNHGKKEKLEFAEYLANWIGLQQRKQSGGAALAKAIDRDAEKAKEALEAMVRAYQAEMDRLGR